MRESEKSIPNNLLLGQAPLGLYRIVFYANKEGRIVEIMIMIMSMITVCICTKHK